MPTLNTLLRDARACTLCAPKLPHAPRPVLQAHAESRILIAGQAPGRKVHESGIPWSDASGQRLREWMGVTAETFYDPRQIALVPMGFCCPGKGKSGDLPPRPECAGHWRDRLLAQLKNIQLTLVIGQYALAYHLPDITESMTDTVRHWRQHHPAIFVLPHPSPRNNIWLRKNAWFEREVLPALKRRVQASL